jgi:hypothetical protein
MATKYRLILLMLMTLSFRSQPMLAQADQQGFRLGLKIPYTYDFTYYQRVNPRFGFHAGAQIVTIPFASYPLGIMNVWGADPDITAILEDPYTIGAGLDVGAQYHFGTDNRRYYFGLSGQWMNLLKRDLNDEVINKAFDVDLSGQDIPLGPISKSASTKPLTLNTNYVNLAFVFGKIVPLYNQDREIRIEVEISKIIFSHHHLQSDYRYITPISDRTNTELQSTMRKYGWFPSINVYYIFMAK